YAGFSLVDEEHQILTIEFKINFLRPARGDALWCQSRIIREGRQLLVAESEVFATGEHEEKETARALVTLMAVPGTKLSAGDQVLGLRE
ncbi:MAG: PaaI family thioesterase, partial [Thermodesulfobacteriota bacterium]